MWANDWVERLAWGESVSYWSYEQKRIKNGEWFGGESKGSACADQNAKIMEKITSKSLIRFQGIIHRTEEASRQVEVDPQTKDKGTWRSPKAENHKQKIIWIAERSELAKEHLKRGGTCEVNLKRDSNADQRLLLDPAAPGIEQNNKKLAAIDSLYIFKEDKEEQTKTKEIKRIAEIDRTPGQLIIAAWCQAIRYQFLPEAVQFKSE